MPAGTPVEQTAAVLHELGAYLATRARGHRLPGLRRHRRADQLQRPGAPVLPAHRRRGRRPPGQPRRQAPPQRAEPRHRDAACGRRCRRSARRFGANVKVVEVPPGPPVLSPIVAEIYGPEAEGRRAGRQGGARGLRADRRASSTSTTAASPPRRRRCCWSTAARPRCWACRSKRSSRTLRAGLAGEATTYLHDETQVPGRGDAAAARRAARRPRRAAAARRALAPRASWCRSASWSPSATRCANSRSTTRTCCR